MTCLVHRGGQPAHQVLEIGAEPGSNSGKRNPLGDHPMGGTIQSDKIGLYFESPGTQIQMSPRRRHRTSVITGSGVECTQGAAPGPRAQDHVDDHPGGEELNADDGDARKAHEMLECSGGTHGFGSFGTVVLDKLPSLGPAPACHSTGPGPYPLKAPLGHPRSGMVPGSPSGTVPCPPTREYPGSDRLGHPHVCRKTRTPVQTPRAPTSMPEDPNFS